MDLRRLPPEARLLFAATREPTWDRDEVREAAAGAPDWTQVRALATQERVLPVVWSRLCEAGIDVPEPHAAGFRMQASVSEFRLSFGELVLGEVVAAARALDMELLLLKGAALALTVYPGFRARPMGDLDVLARPGDVRRLWDALREDGWQLEFEGGDTFYESHQHLPPLVRGGGIGVVLEIHRSLLPLRGPFPPDPAGLWARTEVRTLDQGPVRVLEPSLQVLHLAVHFAWSHALATGFLRVVRDVSAVLAAGSVAWEPLVVEARATRAAPLLYWTLRLARSFGGAPVPDEVLGALAPRRPGWLLDALERAYLEMGLFRSCPSPRLARGLWWMGIDPAGGGLGRERPWSGDGLFLDDVAHVGPSSAPSPGDRLGRVPAGVAFLARVASGRLGGMRAPADD